MTLCHGQGLVTDWAHTVWALIIYLVRTASWDSPTAPPPPPPSERLSLYSTATQNFRVGALRWSRLPTPEFHVGDTNILVSKNTKICVTTGAKPEICVNPNASQWNVGGVGSPMQNFRIGHVHLFCVSISFALGPVFQWNVGFKSPKTTKRFFHYRFCPMAYKIANTVLNL